MKREEWQYNTHTHTHHTIVPSQSRIIMWRSRIKLIMKQAIGNDREREKDRRYKASRNSEVLSRI